MKFIKMHGCGNDYIYVNGFTEEIGNPHELSSAMSHRHFGVGADGLVLILPSEVADFRMRIFNADGTEAEMCGNATRCVAKYVYDNKLTNKEKISLETMAGVKELELEIKNHVVVNVKVDMGCPILNAENIPVIWKEPKLVNQEIEVLGQKIGITSVSMGNPHTVIFVNEVDDFDVALYGKAVENLRIFPNKTNVEFVEIVNSNQIKMRVWERGVGETLACGTGACASVVAGVLNKKLDGKVLVHLLGGKLSIEWNEDCNRIFMRGPAETIFKGKWIK